jgi:hypothetical protein
MKIITCKQFEHEKQINDNIDKMMRIIKLKNLRVGY